MSTAAEAVKATYGEREKVATLAERLLAITAELKPIKATGNAPFGGGKALSIEDVEDAVRPLLIQHSILIRFRTRNLIRADKEWVVEVTALVRDALFVSHGEWATGEWGWDDDWADCGSTPAAAYSFARKSYLKMLFHIAGDDDASVVQNSHQTAAEAPRPSGKPKVINREPTGRVCPECGADLEIVSWDNGGSAIACTGKVNGVWCKYREAVAVDQTPIPF